MDHGNTINQWTGNILSGGAIVATIMGWLPGIAAAVALIWYFIQIYESTTVQKYIADRRRRKIARMRAKLIQLEAQGAYERLLPKDDG